MERCLRQAGAVADYPHANLTQQIIDACYQVFRELGHGFSEKIYQRAVAIVLREMGLAAIEECAITVRFHGTVIGSFKADIVVARTIIVEVKAVRELESRDEAQLLNYLKCAGGGVGLLVNFGHQLQHKRRVMGDPEANLPKLA
jgi:GxxExxY protein